MKHAFGLSRHTQKKIQERAFLDEGSCFRFCTVAAYPTQGIPETTPMNPFRVICTY